MNTHFYIQNTSIVIGEECFSVLHDFLIKNKPSNIFIIVDSNTKQYCLPILLRHMPELLDADIILSKTGENAKSSKGILGFFTP